MPLSLESSPEPWIPRPRRLAAAGAALAAAAWVIHPFDRSLLRGLNPPDAAWLKGLLRFVANDLPSLLLTIAVAGGGIALFRGGTSAWRRAGVALLAAPFAGSVGSRALKAFAGRARPQLDAAAMDGLERVIALADHASFPSGHVTTATVFALTAGAFLRAAGARAALLLLVPLMMWNRVAVAAHFPSDVLAGAALGTFVVAGLVLLLRRLPLRAPSRSAPLVLWALVLLLAYCWYRPLRAVDPAGGAPIDGPSVVPSMGRTLLEPIAGPPLELARIPEPRAFAVAALAWAALAAGLLWAWPGRRRPVRRRLALLGVLLAAVWALVAWKSDLPGDRLRVRGGDGILVDTHVHADDPVDGARPVAFMERRLAARGIGEYVLCNHDAPPPAPGAIPGTEWSGCRHPFAPAIHLVIAGGDGAIDAALAERDPLEAVRAAKAHGGIVVVAHYWTTFRDFRAHGEEPPPPEAFVAAGADGFEVANRYAVAARDDRKLIAAIDRLARERGLLRLAASDDHGKVPAGALCATWLPGAFADDPARRRDEVLARLASRDRVIPVVFRTPWDVVVDAPAALMPPLVVWRYLATVGHAGRASLLAWVAFAWLIARWRAAAAASRGAAAGAAHPRALSASLAGSPGSASGPSNR